MTRTRNDGQNRNKDFYLFFSVFDEGVLFNYFRMETRFVHEDEINNSLDFNILLTQSLVLTF